MGWSPRRTGAAAPVGGTLKRVFDVVGASIALVLLAPLLLVVATLVRLLLGRPVLFPRTAWVSTARLLLATSFARCGSMVRRSRRHETRKLEDDPRATCLSNVLRKVGIDDLPQLFNVLRGDMSLVGPRPVLPREIARYGRHARAYFSARPGLTGMWQVDGGNSAKVSAGLRATATTHAIGHWGSIFCFCSGPFPVQLGSGSSTSARSHREWAQASAPPIR